MPNVLSPVVRQNLSDEIAQRIAQLIHTQEYEPGARLPAISDMARQFGVGAPTLREALKKLEAVGVVDIRHGSGVYVGRSPESLMITNPVIEARASKKILIDLIEARIPIESQTAGLAAVNRTQDHLDEMDRLLERAPAAASTTPRAGSSPRSISRSIGRSRSPQATSFCIRSSTFSPACSEASNS